MQIALSQLNYKAGDIPGNCEKIITAIRKARQSKADLIVFPELAICGALPQDYLEREEFIEECRRSIEKIACECVHIAAIVGGPNLDSTNGIMYNSAYFIRDGEVVDGVHKNILSDYDIFNESRYFVAGEDNAPIHYKNLNIRIIFDEYEAGFIEKNDNLVLYIGMSPFTTESSWKRKEILADLSGKYRKNILHVNHCGSYTSVLFDGLSMGFNEKGEQIYALKEFEEDFVIIDTLRPGQGVPFRCTQPEKFDTLHRALVFGIRDYFHKHNFSKAVLGLSGGIDSAVVAVLAAEALGSENVTGLLMPSDFSTGHSVTDAKKLAENIGIHYDIVPIKDIYGQYLKVLQPIFQDLPFNVAEENIQARIRGMIIMAISNKYGLIPLNTSNKSEAAVGYGTLYGDLCGSLGVIGDVYKSDIFRLARNINDKREIIPEHTITKAPSAELRPGQKDQDSLPDYTLLDAILKRYIEGNACPENIIAEGYPREIVLKIVDMVRRNEYKRAQCPPIIKVSAKTFCCGRKYPY